MIYKNIWGPSTWLYLHTVTLTYPDNPSYQDKLKYINFFNNIILPCEECEKDFKLLLKKHPIEHNVSSKNKLIHWLIKIHNIVNVKLNKPIRNYNDMIEFVNNGVTCNHYINILLCFIIIFCLLLVLYKFFFSYNIYNK